MLLIFYALRFFISEYFIFIWKTFMCTPIYLNNVYIYKTTWTRIAGIIREGANPCTSQLLQHPPQNNTRTIHYCQWHLNLWRTLFLIKSYVVVNSIAILQTLSHAYWLQSSSRHSTSWEQCPDTASPPGSLVSCAFSPSPPLLCSEHRGSEATLGQLCRVRIFSAWNSRREVSCWQVKFCPELLFGVHCRVYNFNMIKETIYYKFLL
jgi:hypothetical protein